MSILPKIFGSRGSQAPAATETSLPKAIVGPSDLQFPNDLPSQQKLAEAQALNERMLDAYAQAYPEQDAAKVTGIIDEATKSKGGGTSEGFHAKINGVDVMFKPRYAGDQLMDVKDMFMQRICERLGVPHLAAGFSTYKLDDSADPLVVMGYSRARIKGEDAVFNNHPEQWTDAQKWAVEFDLAKSLWSGNDDTGTRQDKTAKITVNGQETTGIIDGDWDHAQPEAKQFGVDQEFDRRTGYNNFATAQALAMLSHVYSDVDRGMISKRSGKTPMNLDVVRAASRKFASATREDILYAIEPYIARVAHEEKLTPEQAEARRKAVADGLMTRGENLESVTERLLQSLEQERTLRGEGNVPLGENMGSKVKDAVVLGQGWLGQTELFNQTFNRFIRSTRQNKGQIPVYRQSDIDQHGPEGATPVKYVSTKAFFKKVNGDIAQYESDKAARKAAKKADKANAPQKKADDSGPAPKA